MIHFFVAGKKICFNLIVVLEFLVKNDQTTNLISFQAL